MPPSACAPAFPRCSTYLAPRGRRFLRIHLRWREIFASGTDSPPFPSLAGTIKAAKFAHADRPAEKLAEGQPAPPDPSTREGLLANQHPMEGDFRLRDSYPSLPALAGEHRDCRVRPRRALRLKTDSGAARAAPTPPRGRDFWRINTQWRKIFASATDIPPFPRITRLPSPAREDGRGIVTLTQTTQLETRDAPALRKGGAGASGATG